MRYSVYSEGGMPILSIKEIGYSEDPLVTRYGSKTRNSYIIHYVLSGKGRFRGRRFGKGDGFLIKSGERGEYYPENSDPWRFLWIVSDDNDMGKIFEIIAPKGEDSFRFDFFDALEKLAYKLKYSERRMLASSEVLSLFLEIFKHHEKLFSRAGDENANAYARTAREYLEENLNREISVDSVAQMLGVSRSYLYKMFVSAYGVSPRAYLTDARVLRAKELLSSGGGNVSEIAREVGYEDVLEFSKFFRRRTGISPSEYRRKKQL